MPGPRILVVDDDPAIRLLCRVNLELDGFAVSEAATLGAARDALAAGDVAGVLLDVHVGNEDGRDLLAELRSERPELGVGLLTGSADPAHLGSEITPDALVPKPFTIEQLQQAVALLLRREAV